MVSRSCSMTGMTAMTQVCYIERGGNIYRTDTVERREDGKRFRKGTAYKGA